MAFSVQPLLFDLTNATLESVPTISGVASRSTAWLALEQYFVRAYFTRLQTQGQPLLSCYIAVNNAPVSAMWLIDLEFNIYPYLDTTTSRPYSTATSAQK